MTEQQKDNITERWNQCDRNKKIRLAVEYFKAKQRNQEERDWWLFLDKKLTTSTGEN